MTRSAKNTTGTLSLPSPLGSDFGDVCRAHQRQLFEESCTQEILEVRPEPVLVWPIPDYIPPPQRSSQNKLGFSRSRNVRKLQDQLGWQLKSGEAVWDNSVPTGPRVVSVTTWKPGVRYDAGNYIQACKALLDSLQPDIIIDDHILHCSDFYSQRSPKKDKMGVGTLVIVYDVIKVQSRVRRVSIVGLDENGPSSRQRGVH